MFLTSRGGEKGKKEGTEKYVDTVEVAIISWIPIG